MLSHTVRTVCAATVAAAVLGLTAAAAVAAPLADSEIVKIDKDGQLIGLFQGNGAYVANGAGQTLTHKVKKGKSVRWTWRVTNDGSGGDITVKGSPNLGCFKVGYSVGGDFTDQIIAGSTNFVEAGGFIPVGVTVKAKNSCASGTTKSIKLDGSPSQGGGIDRAIARVQVK
jgi:hypothetical protein